MGFKGFAYDRPSGDDFHGCAWLKNVKGWNSWISSSLRFLEGGWSGSLVTDVAAPAVAFAALGAIVLSVLCASEWEVGCCGGDKSCFSRRRRNQLKVFTVS